MERKYLCNACLHDNRAGQEDPCHHLRVFASFAQSVDGQAMVLERLRLTMSTPTVYGKATRTRTRHWRRFLVKIVRATCRPYVFFL